MVSESFQLDRRHGSRSLPWPLLVLVLLSACSGSPEKPASLPPVVDPRTASQPDTTQPRDGVEVGKVDRSGSFTPVFVETAPPASEPQAQSLPQAGMSVSNSAAVVALVDTAGRQAASGNLDRAAATLERAVRIEPGNAGLWHDLSKVTFGQGQYRESESLALRSNALAAHDRRLQAANWRLIEQARKAYGDASGASEAADQALAVERSP